MTGDQPSAIQVLRERPVLRADGDRQRAGTRIIHRAANLRITPQRPAITGEAMEIVSFKT